MRKKPCNRGYLMVDLQGQFGASPLAPSATNYVSLEQC